MNYVIEPSEGLKIINSLELTPVKRREWFIWASKHQPCPKCKEAPLNACVNLVDAKYVRDKNPKCPNIRKVKWPHSERIDWGRLVAGLVQRGYYVGEVEYTKKFEGPGFVTPKKVDKDEG